MLIETFNLYVGYNQDLPLINAVNLGIQEGSMIGLLGSNGSGKTSLVRTLTGLIPPLRGKITKKIDSSITLVPQMKNLRLEFPMSIKEALRISMIRGIGLSNKWNPSADDREVIDRTGVGEFWELLLRECSGGQLQRFLIARSLLSKAKLVFLDEPLDALDKSSQNIILTLLKERQVQYGTSFFIITHNLSETWKPNLSHIFKINDQSLISLDIESLQEVIYGT